MARVANTVLDECQLITISPAPKEALNLTGESTVPFRQKANAFLHFLIEMIWNKKTFCYSKAGQPVPWRSSGCVGAGL